ncbi:MAG TPA: carboxypeptidase M32 [Candidatus Izemoplasmatales bacterium]|nr:carboxypeptidase M32 [Bacillota bacterium]HRY77383.1 carboxypeptidase M32 [Candidatus Izemoplasmatales bacterium]
MEKALKKYQETNEKLRALGLAMFLNGWDTATEAPRGSMAHRSGQIGTLSEMTYRLSTDPDYEAAIETLFQHREELDDILHHEIELARKRLVKMKKVPIEEYVAYNRLMAEIYPIYVEAKQTSNYALYKPHLLKVIEFQKKYLGWEKTPELQGYDILLDEYEPEYGTKEYDAFFKTLKERLVPFAKAVSRKKLKYNAAFTKKTFPKEGQREFAKYLQTVMCFDPDRTVIKESEHPFTSGNGCTDVRITNHYHENDLTSAIFSAIHEMGHGLYELQIDPALDETNSGGGVSMAMHESQSRLMENMIGRSEVFWRTHLPKLQELFPKALGKTTLDDFVKHVNRVSRGFIRTEADELTYSIHVMIRYEIEKGILSGRVDVEDLPSVWNKKYKQYLGIVVPDDKRGILQDVHWSQGSFGYFPTYSLGSAYAAQIYHAMAKDVDIDAAIASGTIRPIADWLKEHIHRYGSTKYPKEILRLATGEDFNPNYYVDYLIQKYSKIYGL